MNFSTRYFLFVTDVFLCTVDTHSPFVSVVGGPCILPLVPCHLNPFSALSSDLTPVSVRHLSRWLCLLARYSSRARPVRPPAVYRPITVVGAAVFIRCLGEIGTETFLVTLPTRCHPDPTPSLTPTAIHIHTQSAAPCPDQLSPLRNPLGTSLTIITTLLIVWVHSSFHRKSVPEKPANEARQRDRGLCCFTGRPSGCIPGSSHHFFPVLLPFPSTFSREQCISVDNVFAISSDLLEAYHDNRITIDPQGGYCIVVFAEFPHLSISLLDRLGSSSSSGRFRHASLCWTLAVRLAGCDAAFDGVSALEAGELLDELTWDSEQNHMIPRGSQWSTPAEQEAIRTFFWARTGGSQE
ncbi:hypothetical protein B0H13DRAFT_2555621 [Mycena leptocephala]|nr:hypothetical protein B0H13DRAFT_2555621 [Mycena leptocephala]